MKVEQENLLAAHLFLGDVAAVEQTGGGMAVVRVDDDGIGIDASPFSRSRR